ncbi:UDP-4-amino-4,6-dideoxy-N-acetyl-beta-L-altrosamine transaminase [Patescibacteria group bacterium]|nr:UDP-4-amino-4,6-dideoxy-N-acetyl-beta-L-altrosamine transaminase [Patescibacteria group bacterium]
MVGGESAKGYAGKLISYGRQSIGDDDIQAVCDALKSDFLTQGPLVQEFEQKLADYCGARFAVAFSNGTAALHGAYFAAGLSEGDEFICPANTFAATSNAGVYLGGKPVFIDIELETGNIDASKIEEKITSKTKVITPVDFAGQPVDLDEIKSLAKAHNLLVIEDACHALGATYKGEKPGTLADMTVFSFHPIKSITTCEGGAVLTDNEEFAQKMQQFRTHGITKTDQWTSQMQFLGFNYRLSELHSALGISQLKKIDNFIQKRKKIAEKYNNELSTKLSLPLQKPDRTSAWHLYSVKVPKEKAPQKKQILQALMDKGIAAQVHYIPVYHHPFYEKNFPTPACENAEEHYSRVITLPIYTDLTEEDQSYVIETINSLISS